MLLRGVGRGEAKCISDLLACGSLLVLSDVLPNECEHAALRGSEHVRAHSRGDRLGQLRQGISVRLKGCSESSVDRLAGQARECLDEGQELALWVGPLMPVSRNPEKQA
jgi:hypothetical protein